MNKVTGSLLAAAVFVTIALAQSSTPSSASGSAVQQQSSTELKTNPSPSQNTQASGEASGAAQFAPGTVLPAELAKSVDAKKAKQGDQVVAKISQDMLSNGQIVIPHGAKIIGHVTQAKAREKGEPESTLGIAFDKVMTKDGKEVPLNASIQALGAPISNFSAGNPGGNPPMSESGGMPGRMGGSGDTGASGSRNSGSAPGAPGGGGNYPDATSTGAQGGSRPLASNATGVVGISGLSLGAGSDGGSVITSENKNVKLDSGTQILLKVNGR